MKHSPQVGAPLEKRLANRLERYQELLQFIGKDLQRERKQTNRRMFNAFLWCFLLPVCFGVVLAFLIRIGLIAQSRARHLDWLILLFPIFYSLYILSFEVLVEVPAAFRRGGMMTSLGQAAKEGEWRTRVCENLLQVVHAEPDEWKWLSTSLAMDLKNMQSRNRYMTALGGAVFFLLLQGIDSLGNNPVEYRAAGTYILSWFESSSYNISQFVALLLFLILFYVSGSQNYYSLLRYLGCTELLILDFKTDSAARTTQSAL